MDATMIDQHLENLDRRLTRVEQILPTLATKDDLKTLATKDELRTAIAPLATTAELHRAIDEASETLRRHMTILSEHHDSKLELVAEHLLRLKRPEE